MRLATFNLLHGMPIVGGGPAFARDDDGRLTGPPIHTDDAALRASARMLAADVVGLQEVDRHQPRSGGHDQTAIVAQEMGAEHFLFAPSVVGTPGDPGGWVVAEPRHDLVADDLTEHGPLYGVGLVSKWPLLDWQVHRFDAAPLSLPLVVPGTPRPQVVKVADEPRVAIAAVIDGPTGPFSVATAHLSFVPGYNGRQLRALKALVADLPRPLFLMGDFNLPGRWPRRLTGFTSLATGATYPSVAPRVQFDHVLADGLPEHVRTVATVHALPVSDHCALSVDVLDALEAPEVT